MINIHKLLIERFSNALEKLGINNTSIPISRSNRPEFGDYQFNGAMALSKQLKQNPLDIANKIVDLVYLDDIASKIDIAKPGFINIYLDDIWLAKQCEILLTKPYTQYNNKSKQNIVVDYSSPNLAKEMHVGHLRSTIIGDSVVRILEFLGHNVIRQNHMGDWGTQFGMLLAHLSDTLESQIAETALSDIENFYREAKVRFDEEVGFSDRARQFVVKLQSGDEQCVKLWQIFIDISIQHSEDVYKKLNVTLTRNDIMAESAYNHDLHNIVNVLKEKSILSQDNGAQVVFLPNLTDKKGKSSPYIIQKSDGGFLYSTTDLAAIRYRCNTLNADRTLIFTDARQILHFKQTEYVARKAGFINNAQSYEHCPFGMMLGSDGKPFKTRDGGTIKLVDLLNESIEKATLLIKEKNPELSNDELKIIARKVGIGAVKYADLSKNRTTDYIFNWDSMLSFEGNTSPYLQYAYTRIKSLFRKANIDSETLCYDISLIHNKEHSLALLILQFNEIINIVSRDATPHILCNYLYELASAFMSFYEACPILKDNINEETRLSRLALSSLVANTLKQGLTFLGIETLEKM
tara:strand:- start:1762 stop:3495 length:1734 start_codon:yes stop_codon:yes gene_type:complete